MRNKILEGMLKDIWAMKHHVRIIERTPDTELSNVVQSTVKQYIIENSKLLDTAVSGLVQINTDQDVSEGDLHRIDSYLQNSNSIIDLNGHVINMHPIEKYLPREMAKFARLERSEDGYDVLISVRGGLYEENKEEFLGLSFLRNGSEVANYRKLTREIPIGFKPTVMEPVYKIVKIGKEEQEQVLHELEKKGYNIE